MEESSEATPVVSAITGASRWLREIVCLTLGSGCWRVTEAAFGGKMLLEKRAGGESVEMLGGTVGLIIGIAVLVLIVLLIIYLVSRRSRSRRQEQSRERTREEFGPEYERTARERGSEREAEKELRQRRGRLERQIQPLSDDARSRYEERWREVESLFVDNPMRSVEMADRTVSDLLDERNFVSDTAQSDEETQRSLGAMHPDVADDYREARRIRAAVVGRSASTSDSGEGDSGTDEATEEMREAVRRYRVVYEKLVEG